MGTATLKLEATSHSAKHLSQHKKKKKPDLWAQKGTVKAVILFPRFDVAHIHQQCRATRITTLYSVDPVLDRNHDAVIRIEGLAPEWWAHSSDRHLGHGLLSGCHHPGSPWSDQRPSGSDR